MTAFRALAAERNHQQRLLNDFADQLRDDLEKIVLSLTAEIAELSRLLAELRAVQRKPLATPPPSHPPAH
jgi:hypothetical protein